MGIDRYVRFNAGVCNEVVLSECYCVYVNVYVYE